MENDFSTRVHNTYTRTIGKYEPQRKHIEAKVAELQKAKAKSPLKVESIDIGRAGREEKTGDAR